ncbi:hypothetical protein [Marinobacter qingdaonensis]|uniref:Uncharacterized protein n=1 Tax=Marinobacter qingdaonensis TaxID=3108486 RepID=A0ABU5NZI2_9GAMM|nr:hypothetical protein [Marinobacter sp. ASW11-75]MEA1081147.1 hypothetical protein [Marinobacter sp. ASW11-75]
MKTFKQLFPLLALVIAAGHAVSDEHSELIADALSAAPISMRDKATVMDWNNNILQEGDGSYVCYPTPPTLQGTAPMCLDGPWQQWANAWINKQPHTPSDLGIAYMLAGDAGASNVDPYAEGKTDDNEWVEEGPHLMIIVPNSDLLNSLPTDPQNGGPYVMWKGTDYAHIMVPVTMDSK